jgi:hypothetical protein
VKSPGKSAKNVDFGLVGEVAVAGAHAPITVAPQAAAVAVYAEEVAALNQGKLEFVVEEQALRLQQLRAEVTEARQTVLLKDTFSKQILYYLWIFSGFCGAVLLLQGFSIFGFKLDTPVLVTLVGGTAASALSLVSVVLGGLFKSSPKEKSKPPHG